MKPTGNKNVDYEILNRLDDKSLLSYCSTSKHYKEICNNQDYWKNRFFNKHGKYLAREIVDRYKHNKSWSEYYIEISSKVNTKYPEYELATALQSKREDIAILLQTLRNANVNFINMPHFIGYTDSKNNKQGKVKYFYTDGNLQMKREYKNDQPIGLSESYYESGNLWYAANFVFKPQENTSYIVGEAIVYNQDGSVSESHFYDNEGRKIN